MKSSETLLGRLVRIKRVRKKGRSRIVYTIVYYRTDLTLDNAQTVHRKVVAVYQRAISSVATNEPSINIVPGRALFSVWPLPCHQR